MRMKIGTAATEIAGWVVMAACFWLLALGFPGTSMALALPGESVTIASWFGLFAGCAVAAPLLWRLDAGTHATRWLALAAYCLLIAAILYGANQGLDALHGAGRKKADVAAHLGGIELWLILVPGLLSVSLGGWARAAVRRRRRLGIHPGLH